MSLMAGGIVTLAVKKLWELVSQQHEKLEGVEEQVIELKSDLNMLMSFLQDVDAKKQTSALARNCVEEIKEIIYDAEDTIDTFLLKDEGRKCGGIKNGMRSLACIPGSRGEIASEITRISKRITKVIHVMQSFGIQQTIIDGGYSQAIQERKRVARHTFSTKSENNLVGLEKNVEKLVGILMENDSSRVVCITGLGGLGKTTLAQHVFNHDKVKHYFEGGLAWVCVSQEVLRISVWKTILQNLSHGDKNSDIRHMTEDEVKEKLVQLLETQKILIVFDDIWKKEDWDAIKPIFPESKGWKVLLTSRNDRIDPQCVPFKPDLLGSKESWELLEMIAFPKNNPTGYIVDEEMVEMAKVMTKSCGGLPLAIKVLGGLLAMQYTLREWKLIYGNIKSHIVGGINFNDYDNSSVYHVLSLSFEGLPVYLKHCLLQLASFPEDYRINLEQLSYYWDAEGISKPWQYDGASVRDVGDVYIDELVKRNMVISERDSATSRYDTCHLHDMMREICLLKAKEENLFQIDSSTLHSHNSRKSRRLVVHCSAKYCGDNEVTNPKLRSLLFIDPYWCGPRPRLCLTRLQLLRILDLTHAKFKGKKLPSGIGKLIHLRYLSLFRAELTHLPSSLMNLKLLLYLNLHVFGPMYVPNVFQHMQELRYLRLPEDIRSWGKLELGNLVKLETLENFSTKYSSLKYLLGMTKLTTLRIVFEGGCTVGDLSSALSKLKTLENLALYDRRNVDEKDAEKFVLDCIHLNMLHLHIYMSKLPDEHQISSHLTSISLGFCRLEEDPMPILEKLLHLTEINLGAGSFRGKKMVCSQGGFPKLTKLRISLLEDLEEWKVEKGSMPILHTLEIDTCEKLKEFPEGIKFLLSLKQLRVAREKIPVKESLKEGGEDFYKVQHIPSVRFLYIEEIRQIAGTSSSN